VLWGHHLRREQSLSTKAAMLLLGRDLLSPAFSPALARMDSLRCEQRQGRQYSTLRSCCRARHRPQMSRCIRYPFTRREGRLKVLTLKEKPRACNKCSKGSKGS
jgi:hypothetical protein